ncbi:MAG: hypothetical protein KF802_01290 [Bdellovibrionaceae bacterium]|nr:hypothetical protein [Pseudobdellovibrionaceae bacterium]MBX3034337.1 hypothetical protein [Pseudobdellovibrionaceae bacterium]
MRAGWLLSLFFLLGACASQNCRSLNEKNGVARPPLRQEVDPMSRPSHADRVRVYKPDGSLQCNQGKTISLSEMQKELKGITVHGSFNQHDGLMRIQMCGTPTGNSNVYEIDRQNLEAALKAGFKEWTAE